ncbi:MAG TPA: fibrobacter succinogenes major paralogous domain-containing protein [Bacteroidales bacterium]|jgi:uncharacterized protein (TIGR02145 family)|nr:fibrobacter succinogenes major paralogous domain-containing protein [Bacteroidales bacterium]
MKKIVKIKFCILLCCVLSFVFISCDKRGKDKDDDNNTTGIIFNADKTYGTVTDVDGNTYKTIQIGTQIWMAENLKTEHYANGDAITYITDFDMWENILEGAWTYYNDNENMNKDYGKLYNWYSVEDSRNICPSGWHIPDDPEWEALLSNLGGYLVAGAKIKETGLNHFAYTNEGSTNESGFTALPGGMKDFGSISFDLGLSGYWWSSTNANDYYDLDAYYYYIGRDVDPVLNGTGDKNNGISCRCVKD